MEVDLRHRALIDGADCCEAGHPDALEAAQHAWILTQALARHGMTGNAALRGDSTRRDRGNTMASGTRDGNGRFTRTADTAKRDADAAALRAKGRTFDQIAADMDYSSRAKAYEAVMRAYADIPYEQVEEARRLDLERLDRLIEQAWAVMEREHVTVSQGRVVGKQTGFQHDPDTGDVLRDSDNQPIPEYADILDDGPLLAAIREIRGLLERRAKIIGYEAPARHEVLTIDAIDAEIRDLKKQLAEAPAELSAEHDG